MNPTSEQAQSTTGAASERPVLDRDLLTKIVEEMSAANPYGLGNYTDEDAGALGIDSLGSLRLAHQLVKAWTGSPLIPKWIANSPNPAGTFVSAILRGKELGFKMMESLQSLYMSPDGRLGLYGSAMIALMRKYNVRLAFTELKDSDGKPNGYQVHGKRENGDEYTATFTRADAMTARLGNVHNSYPMVMCQWRAVSILFRFLCSDLSGGSLYTIEELREEAPEESKQPEGKEPNPYHVAEKPIDTGGAPPNTREAAQNVAKRRIEEEMAKAAAQTPSESPAVTNTAPPANPKAPEPPKAAEKPAVNVDDPGAEGNKTHFGEMVSAFQVQKLRLGEPLYRAILLEHGGVKRSNQFKSMALARSCYKIMLATTPPDVQPNPYQASDDDLPANMQPNTAGVDNEKTPGINNLNVSDAQKPAGASTASKNPISDTPTPSYAEEIKAELASIVALYDKKNKDGVPLKSPDTIKRAVDGFMRGFYAAGKPKSDESNIGSIRITMGFLRRLMTDYPALIVESASKAEATGRTVAEGHRQCVSFLDGKSEAFKRAFWDMAIVRYPDSGGRDIFEVLDDSKVLTATTPESEWIAYFQVFTRTREVHRLADQSRTSGVPMYKIVAGWGIDVATAPVAGIEALLKGGSTPKASEPVQAALVPEGEPVEDGDDSWLTITNPKESDNA